MSFLRQVAENSILLDLYIRPKASKDTICGLHGDELKLAIIAPPVDGKANKAVITYLANFFGVTKSSVSIVNGFQSRHKRCAVQGITLAEADKKLSGVLSFPQT